MGRPPGTGAPAFRFTPAEVAEMEAHLQQLNNAIPSRILIQELAEKFTTSAARAGQVVVQHKQVWNWFQNRRYSRSRNNRAPPAPQGRVPPVVAGTDEQLAASFRAHPSASTHSGSISGKNSSDGDQVEFEAKSARDGAWYDVAAFLNQRLFETGDPEVRVHFAGFGAEEDEWINVRKCVRQRSLPCVPTECFAVLPEDHILCFQEGKEQALYFDACVLDAQRRMHDVRGCRCRFLVRYDHDHSEEIVPLRKVCRRPGTGYRLQIMQAQRAASSADVQTQPKDAVVESAQTDKAAAEQGPSKKHKMMDVNTGKMTMVRDPASLAKTCNDSGPDVPMWDVEPSQKAEAGSIAQDMIKEEQ